MSHDGHGGARAYGEARITDAPIVLVEPGQPIDSALKKFARRVQRAGVLQELKRRETFIPPSQRRRLKSLRARKRDAKTAARRSGASERRAGAETV